MVIGHLICRLSDVSMLSGPSQRLITRSSNPTALSDGRVEATRSPNQGPIVLRMSQFRYRARELAEKARNNSSEPYWVALARGSLELGYYAPVEIDHQEPHDQDEVYVVISGEGRFRNGDAMTEFGPGDALFVPAGVDHRFLDFSDDTQMWVIFYGPEGGEDE